MYVIGSRRRKKYIDCCVYHIYNRGVGKARIFRSRNDYVVYLRFLKEYLSPREYLLDEIMSKKIDSNSKLQRIHYLDKRKDYSKTIKLYSFALMPNHIHLEVEQAESRAIAHFMASLHTRYVKYFNKKYERIGPLFQDRYNAVSLQSNLGILRVSKYIHRNPINIISKIENFPWSSMRYYHNSTFPVWIYPDRLLEIYRKLSLHNNLKRYTDFVKDGFIS